MKQEEKGTKRICWINIAKVICILAVISQHGGLAMQLPYPLYRATELAVPTFFVLAGLTQFLSCKRNAGMSVLGEIVRHEINLLGPYTLATAFYTITMLKQFDFVAFINSWLNFNASPPFYFTFIYVQFIIVAPFLARYLLYFKEKPLAQYLLIPVLIGLSYVLIHYTRMLNLHGGGLFLLGGTFLPMFYIGMLIGSKYDSLRKNVLRFPWVHVVGSTILWGGWLYVMCVDNYAMDSRLPFGNGLNPPSISCFVFGLVTLYWFASVGIFLEDRQNHVLKVVINKLSKCGKYTMYIYLYHWYILNTICYQLPITSIHIKRVAYYGLMIGIPVLICEMVGLVKAFYKRIMQAAVAEE